MFRIVDQAQQVWLYLGFTFGWRLQPAFFEAEFFRRRFPLGSPLFVASSG
jgi:hypothetical protein